MLDLLVLRTSSDCFFFFFCHLRAIHAFRSWKTYIDIDLSGLWRHMRVYPETFISKQDDILGFCKTLSFYQYS